MHAPFVVERSCDLPEYLHCELPAFFSVYLLHKAVLYMNKRRPPKKGKFLCKILCMAAYCMTGKQTAKCRTSHSTLGFITTGRKGMCPLFPLNSPFFLGRKYFSSALMKLQVEVYPIRRLRGRYLVGIILVTRFKV